MPPATHAPEGPCEDVIEAREKVGRHDERLTSLEHRADRTDATLQGLSEAMRDLTATIAAGQRQIFLAVIGITTTAALTFLGYLILHALGGKV